MPLYSFKTKMVKYFIYVHLYTLIFIRKQTILVKSELKKNLLLCKCLINMSFNNSTESPSNQTSDNQIYLKKVKFISPVIDLTEISNNFFPLSFFTLQCGYSPHPTVNKSCKFQILKFRETFTSMKSHKSRVTTEKLQITKDRGTQP